MDQSICCVYIRLITGVYMSFRDISQYKNATICIVDWIVTICIVNS